jgi:hypothetical protein
MVQGWVCAELVEAFPHITALKELKYFESTDVGNA